MVTITTDLCLELIAHLQEIGDEEGLLLVIDLKAALQGKSHGTGYGLVSGARCDDIRSSKRSDQ